MKSFGLGLVVIEQFDRFDLVVYERHLSVRRVVSTTGMWMF